MNRIKKCVRVKNPCKICLQQVSNKNGLQCKGACKRWAHFTCLNYTPGKIQDIKAGIITITCPCPTCNVGEQPKEIIKDASYSCGNNQCPANIPPPRCEHSPIPEHGDNPYDAVSRAKTPPCRMSKCCQQKILAVEPPCNKPVELIKPERPKCPPKENEPPCSVPVVPCPPLVSAVPCPPEPPSSKPEPYPKPKKPEPCDKPKKPVPCEKPDPSAKPAEPCAKPIEPVQSPPCIKPVQSSPRVKAVASPPCVEAAKIPCVKSVESPCATQPKGSTSSQPTPASFASPVKSPCQLPESPCGRESATCCTTESPTCSTPNLSPCAQLPCDPMPCVRPLCECTTNMQHSQICGACSQAEYFTQKKKHKNEKPVVDTNAKSNDEKYIEKNSGTKLDKQRLPDELIILTREGKKNQKDKHGKPRQDKNKKKHYCCAGARNSDSNGCCTDMATKNSCSSGKAISCSCIAPLGKSGPECVKSSSDSALRKESQKVLLCTIHELCSTVGHLSEQVKELLTKMMAGMQTKACG